MERDANVDKKKQMTLTFQMRRRTIFDVLSPCLKDSEKRGISSLIYIILLLMSTMHVKFKMRFVFGITDMQHSIDFHTAFVYYTSFSTIVDST